MSDTSLTSNQPRPGRKKGLWLICISHNYTQTLHCNSVDNGEKQSSWTCWWFAYCRAEHTQEHPSMASWQHHQITWVRAPSPFLNIIIMQKHFMPPKHAQLEWSPNWRQPSEVEAGGTQLQHWNGDRRRTSLCSTAFTSTGNLHCHAPFAQFPSRFRKLNLNAGNNFQTYVDTGSDSVKVGGKRLKPAATEEEAVN